MSPLKNTNKFLSDYLPPALVKDWRQCFRSRSSVALFLLLELAGWLIFACMVAGGERTAAEHLKQMEELGGMLYGLGVFALCLIIPFRAGATVSADTRVRSSNFLMLTPLSARRIVWGTWSSTALIVLLAALLALPLLFARRLMMTATSPFGPFDVAAFNAEGLAVDAMMLGWLVLIGWVMAGFYMFSSVLPRILRVLLFIFCGIEALTLVGSYTVSELFGVQAGELLRPELFNLGLHALDAVLLLILFLELSRRHYAAPAENCSRAVRLLAPLPMLVYGALLALDSCYGWALPDPEGQLAFALIYLFTALLSDALLPNYAMPAHAYRLWSGWPAWLQKPGFVPSTLCLALGTFFVALPDGVQFAQSGKLSELYEGAYRALNLGCSLMLWLLITDCFCRRSAAKRPLVFGVVALACYLAVLCISMPLEGFPAWEAALPRAGVDAWYDTDKLAFACAVDGVAFFLLLLLLVFWRGRVKKS